MKVNEEFIITRRLLHLSTLLINHRQEEFNEYGITFVQAESLIYFDKVMGAKSMDLKKHLNISHQAARGIVDRLGKKKYVYLEVSKEDARSKHVYLTKEGQHVCDKLKELGILDGSRLLKNIDSEETTQILSMLQKLIENVQ